MGLLHRKKSHKIYYSLLALAIIIAGFFIYSFWTVRSLVWQLNELGDLANMTADSFSSGNHEIRNMSLDHSLNIVSDIQNKIDDLKFLKVLPGIAQSYIATEDVFKRIASSIKQFALLNDEYQEIEKYKDSSSVLVEYLKNTEPQEFSAKIYKVSSILENLFVEIRGIRDDLNILSNNIYLVGYRDKLNDLVVDLDRFSHALDGSVKLFSFAPSFMGYPEPVIYLLLFQNNHEMRATGGFWGSYGTVTIEQGQVTDLFTDDIYHLDSEVIGKLEIEPPAPISKYLGVKYWYFRDANWSPDFPTSAKQAIDFYHWEGGDKQIAGVIAITPDVVSDMISIVGEILVEDILYKADNFTKILQYEVEQNYQARGSTHWDRKDVIGELAKVLINKIFMLSWPQAINLVNKVNANLNSRNIILYSIDQNTQHYIVNQKWSGSIEQTNSDYLMVVDSNMAAYKTNQYIKRTVDYKVEKIKTPTGDYRQSTVIINYDHSGDFSWDSTRYRTYTRIYVPEGAVLIKWAGAMDNDRSSVPGKIDLSQENGKTVFGTFIAIEPGHSGQLKFVYRLPDNLSNDYSFYYQQQPGMNDYLQYSIDGYTRKAFKIEQDVYWQK